MPPVVASPNALVASLKSPHVAPPWERAVFPPASTSTRRIPDKSRRPRRRRCRSPGRYAPRRGREGQIVVTGEVDRRHDVVRVDAANDGRRPPVDHRVVHRAGLVVALVGRSHDLTVSLLSELFDRSSHRFPSGVGAELSHASDEPRGWTTAALDRPKTRNVTHRCSGHPPAGTRRT